MAQGFGNHDIRELTDHAAVTVEVNDAIVLRSARQLIRVLFAFTFHRNTLRGANHVITDAGGLLVNQVLQSRETFFFYLQR